jgi:cysteinyl-tRNA synthetase
LLDGPNRRRRARLGENLIFNKRLNMAAAIAVLFELAKQSGAWISEGAGQEDLLAADTLMQRLTGDALGLKRPSPLGGDAESAKQNDLIRLLADLRDQARKNKDFALSDQVRDRLASLVVQLRDTTEGTKWWTVRRFLPASVNRSLTCVGHFHVCPRGLRRLLSAGAYL